MCVFFLAFCRFDLFRSFDRHFPVQLNSVLSKRLHLYCVQLQVIPLAMFTRSGSINLISQQVVSCSPSNPILWRQLPTERVTCWSQKLSKLLEYSTASTNDPSVSWTPLHKYQFFCDRISFLLYSTISSLCARTPLYNDQRPTFTWSIMTSFQIIHSKFIKIVLNTCSGRHFFQAWTPISPVGVIWVLRKVILSTYACSCTIEFEQHNTTTPHPLALMTLT